MGRKESNQANKQRHTRVDASLSTKQTKKHMILILIVLSGNEGSRHMRRLARVFNDRIHRAWVRMKPWTKA